MLPVEISLGGWPSVLVVRTEYGESEPPTTGHTFGQTTSAMASAGKPRLPALRQIDTVARFVHSNFHQW